jgi:hypothetical protein
MRAQLRCFSFHSVKGGVGKSTLATLAARWLAEQTPDEPVWLVDMDLTGTSLADVLPLEAPAWEDGALPLQQPPTAHLTVEESRAGAELRSDGEDPAFVPYLNDYLLYARKGWQEDQDPPPNHLAWRWAKGPENLRILPSSALPNDLAHILPVIFREDEAAFIEARLEWFLAALAEPDRRVTVVFDTPPTIPGLSRSVLSLAHRLTEEPKGFLSKDGGMPSRLEAAQVDFRAFLVTSLDEQDLRAMARWLALVPNRPPSKAIVQVVVNRVEEHETAANEIRELAVSMASPLLGEAKLVGDDPAWRIFRRGGTLFEAGFESHGALQRLVGDL